jgi:hypothetical protein
MNVENSYGLGCFASECDLPREIELRATFVWHGDKHVSTFTTLAFSLSVNTSSLSFNVEDGCRGCR